MDEKVPESASRPTISHEGFAAIRAMTQYYIMHSVDNHMYYRSSCCGFSLNDSVGSASLTGSRLGLFPGNREDGIQPCEIIPFSISFNSTFSLVICTRAVAFIHAISCVFDSLGRMVSVSNH